MTNKNGDDHDCSNHVAGNYRPSTAVPPPSPGLFAQLIQSREAQARLQVLSHLMSQSDERLVRLGFSAQDVRDLRDGNLRLPVAR
jgi:hypothetical protein